ncbi:MAG: hypothetical protein GYB42_01230 [Alphaproteobacteria bacterium]|jgi:hypothetical protein|nr:hypothetical protein [Alphaproteobacteria bacterium]
MTAMPSSTLSTLSEYAPSQSAAADCELWPGWVRVTLIVGLSAGLWSLITMPFWL